MECVKMKMEKMTIGWYYELKYKYDLLNSDNQGYSVGEENDDINEIDGIGELIVKADNDKEVAIYDNGSKYILVGNANVPWAVNVKY